MNPYEPLKETEHIIGFEKDPSCHPAPSPETMRAAGFKAVDVICWTNQKGLIVFQNGEEFFKPPKVMSDIRIAVEGLAKRLNITPDQLLSELNSEPIQRIGE